MLRGAAGVVLVVAGLAIGGGPAHARPKQVKTVKVEVSSDPPGATVYLNLKEDGPVCDATPCTIDAPIGATPIIVELEGHETALEELVVSKQDKRLKVSYTLAAAVGTIVVKGPPGATIRIDDEEQGTAPARVDVIPGTHVVVLLMNDKQISSAAVEVENHGEAVVEGPKAGSGDGGGGNPDGDDPLEPAITVEQPTKPKVPSAPRSSPILVAALQTDVGFRAFRYQNPQSDKLRPENEGGQVLVGPAIELYPGTLLGVHALRGFALLFHFGFGANSNDVGSSVAGEGTLSASTYWRAIEISARQRWVIAGKASLAVGAGYVQELYRFSGAKEDILLLPDAQYSALRVGARASLLLGAVEPYVLGDTRVVMSGGPLGDRFTQANASGLHAAAGVAIRVGSHVTVKLEGAITRYSWTFESSTAFMADGATDSIKQLGVSLGFQY